MESFLLLPVTMAVPFGHVSNNLVVPIPQIILSQQMNIEADGFFAFNQAFNQEAKTLENKAEAIDAYFRSYDMPLEGMGMTMVVEAEKNNLDWRLLAAIAVNESTGGKFACKTVTYNSFGWGSCKIGFNSNEEAIATIATNLGGNNPKTSHHYAGKDTIEILNSYNPPKIAPKYVGQIMHIMNHFSENLLEIENANTKIA
ncbi:MAG: hypothetical protein ABH951_02370 [Patescibacteria group bacterium]